MSKLGRNMKDTIILDNSPSAYMLQPEMAMPILSWYDDPKDRHLMDILPLLIQISQFNDCRDAITRIVKNNTVDYKWAGKVCSSLLEQQEHDFRAIEEEERQTE